MLKSTEEVHNRNAACREVLLPKRSTQASPLTGLG
jgi:hypothetical protein